jgi:hypothetical protein
MAARLSLLIDNSVLRRQCGARAREKLLESFTVEKTMPAVLSTCRRIAHHLPADAGLPEPSDLPT